MKFVEITDKTIAEAVSKALAELGTTRDRVEVEVIEEPSKGLFGLFGSKPAKVRVTLKEDPAEKATQFLENVLNKMGILANIKTNLKNDNLYIEIDGKDSAILIGRRGQTLDALQYLVSLVVNSGKEDYIRVILDTENYRKKREQTLIRLANKLANKVKNLKKDIKLEPMNPYERRIIHSALQNNPYVGTKSEGEEPYRRVVIFLK
ncbi:spoIIIJ-associated protein [Caminicella sporogenes DSM 14501]|uniref:RNA-binding protein KhpB n=1 Tax=Caminicella sporogenes DSM 14501 TaxID=1121266 RepID=A0A1M6NCF8_9FIRM|nr:RNA-binding cell elongation regulator Jag/EloR [Caminicella sporogenes]RKD22246.1 DNA-binding protein [Caminicella sporogenes]WIF95874.1 RNA-binding cell elongation regulator Jag/EloR [Caminicella sporogenes]SHJ93418.1 spoIIIJ-associated protein [Caminicella sporogenes DSM 14501]